MGISRRNFMKRSLAGAVGITCLPALAWGGSHRIPIALQLYSIRGEVEKDMAGALKAVSAMGYEGVEFAGTFGHSAEDIAQMLTEANLKAVGTHLAVGDLLGERFEETASFNRTIGNCSLIVAGGLGDVLAGDGGNQCAAYLFSEIAQKAKKIGFRIGYHAHASDFTDMGNGQTAWDLFFSRTDPDVIAEMDIGNCLVCGADPYQSIEKMPGRGRLIHLKAAKTDGTVLGSEGDGVDWARVFRLCESGAGTEWYIVEQEGGGPDTNSMNAAAQCIENLRKMGKC